MLFYDLTYRAYLSRTGSRGGGGGGTTPGREDHTLEHAIEEEEGALSCSNCLYPITRVDEKTAVAGAHEHVFANPEGVIFEIGCFRLAPGCEEVGPSTLEFTWFDGYAWQAVVCRGCMNHIGWFYSGSGGSFYGLILNRLVGM